MNWGIMGGLPSVGLFYEIGIKYGKKYNLLKFAIINLNNRLSFYIASKKFKTKVR